jgi:hypothetical protein
MYAKLRSKKFTCPLKGIDRFMLESVTGEMCLYTFPRISPRPGIVATRIISEIESALKIDLPQNAGVKNRIKASWGIGPLNEAWKLASNV